MSRKGLILALLTPALIWWLILLSFSNFNWLTPLIIAAGFGFIGTGLSLTRVGFHIPAIKFLAVLFLMLGLDVAFAGIAVSGVIYLTINAPNKWGILIVLFVPMSLAFVSGLLAIYEVYRGVDSELSASDKQHNKKRKVLVFKSLVIFFFSPLGLAITWLLAREAAVYWYGENLIADAKASAERIASGTPYCLIESRGVHYIDELDARGIVVGAFNAKFFPSRDYPKLPHFGLKVEDRNYYWSIKKKEFVNLPSYFGTNRESTCTKDMQFMFGR